MKLTRAMLDNVRRVVCHRNSEASACPDGTAAILLADALPHAEITFAAYGPELDAITAEPGLLFADISPRTRVDEYIEAGAIVLDHHASHEEVVRRFGRRGIYGGKMESGASLALDYVWTPVANDQRRHPNECARAARFARLAAVRDTWQRDHELWTAASEQAAALALYSWDDWRVIQRPFFSSSPMALTAIHEAGSFYGGAIQFNTMLACGPPLYAARLRRAQQAARGATYLFTTAGTRLAIVNTLDTSDLAEIVEADVLVGFLIFSDPTPRIRYSFRARRDYDVGSLTKAAGGGGHRAAAGCVAPVEYRLNAVTQAFRFIEDYEASLQRSGSETP